MTDKPTIEEASERLQEMYAAARSFVRLCRTLEFDPRETVATLSTALAIALRQSGTPFGEGALKAIEGCIRVELDHPMAERPNH